LYISGQIISQTGTWAQRVAQDWLVLQLTNSGTALGIVTALQFGPTLIFSLYAGTLADRGNKRRLLIATQSGIGIGALILGVLDVTGLVQLWQVYVMATLVGVLTALDTPIRQSFAVEMVRPADLPNAAALNGMAFSLARIIGPAVSGVVITAVGTGWSFLGNAAATLG
jgi:MFS family permease